MQPLMANILAKLGLSQVPGKAVLKKDCLARKYAGCHDEKHCPYCSPTEQALRTATKFDDGS